MATKKFKVHNMYSKTGIKKVASTLAQHNALKKKGYTHTKKINNYANSKVQVWRHRKDED